MNKQFILIYKNKSNYEPITHFLKMSKIKKITANYKKIKLKNESAAKLYFIFSFPLLLKLRLLPKLIRFIVSKFIEIISLGKIVNNSRNTLCLDFSVRCEPYTFDYGIKKGCPNVEIKEVFKFPDDEFALFRKK